MYEKKLTEKANIVRQMLTEARDWYEKFCKGWDPEGDEEDPVVRGIQNWIKENYEFDAEQSHYPILRFHNKRTGDIEGMQINLEGGGGDHEEHALDEIGGSILHAQADPEHAMEVLKPVMGDQWNLYGPRLIDDFNNDRMDHGHDTAL